MHTDKHISIIVAEDNSPNCQLIESYLSLFPQVQIMHSVSNGEEVLALLAKETPTAIILAIEMPGMNGLATAARIKEIHPHIFIIFVSAHTEYAAEAFQLEATDYLIKPISKESLERAINRIEKYLGFTKNVKLDDILVIKNKSETYLIRLDTIFYIEKEIRKTIIHTENGKYTTSDSLSSLEKRLCSNFFRCHKSFIINIRKIEKIIPIAERVYQVNFYNYPFAANMGRQKFEELYQIINKTT